MTNMNEYVHMYLYQLSLLEFTSITTCMGVSILILYDITYVSSINHYLRLIVGLVVSHTSMYQQSWSG